MSDNPAEDPILTRFRATLAEVYGDRLERVVLYGSRARGDHRPDSDYDIAVFIKDPRLARRGDPPTGTDHLGYPVQPGAVISATPFRAGAHRIHARGAARRG